MEKKQVKIPQGKYLITGAAGLMGTSALLKLCNIEGVNVRAAYHEKEPLLTGAEYLKGNLLNREFCKTIVEGVDYVLMFAGILSTAPVVAKNPVSHIIDNVIMTMQILEAAYFARVKKIVWLSSTTGYADIEKEIMEDDMFIGEPPDNYYAVGHMSRYLETQCKMYAQKLKRKMPIIVLRPTNIYGEWETFNPEKSHVLPQLVRKVVDRETSIEIWGDGTQSRDMVYSGDVVDACIVALNSNYDYNYFNIGSGRNISVKEMLDVIVAMEDFDDAGITYNPQKSASINKRIISCKKAGEELGFIASTTFEVGVSRVIQEYKKQRWRDGVCKL